jgi:hypothetical protein
MSKAWSIALIVLTRGHGVKVGHAVFVEYDDLAIEHETLCRSFNAAPTISGKRSAQS